MEQRSYWSNKLRGMENFGGNRLIRRDIQGYLDMFDIRKERKNCIMATVVDYMCRQLNVTAPLKMGRWLIWLSGVAGNTTGLPTKAMYRQGVSFKGMNFRGNKFDPQIAKLNSAKFIFACKITKINSTKFFWFQSTAKICSPKIKKLGNWHFVEVHTSGQKNLTD